MILPKNISNWEIRSFILVFSFITDKDEFILCVCVFLLFVRAVKTTVQAISVLVP